MGGYEDHDPHVDGFSPNTPAIVSLVTGLLALIGQGCCCVPVLGYLAMLVVPLLTLVCLATGFIGVQKARATGDGGVVASFGLALGVTNLLIDLAYGAVILFFFAMLGIASASG